VNSSEKWKLRFLLLIAVIIIMALTLHPFEFSFDNLTIMFGFGLKFAFWYFLYFSYLDFMFNILMFIPLGILAFRLLEMETDAWSKKRIWRLIAGAGLFSLALETTQAFLPRSTSVLDVITNTSGAVIGYAAAYWYALNRDFVRIPLMPNWRIWAGIAYGAAVAGLCLLPYRLNTLSYWDGEFPLILGNEATGDRPWQGDISLAAVYNGALKPDQIKNLCPERAGEEDYALRRSMHVVALYEMSNNETSYNDASYIEAESLHGNVLADLSEYGEPLPLFADHIEKSPNSIRLLRKSRISSKQSGGKITEAAGTGHAFSVELRIRPLSLDQRGPARLISLSGSPEERDFTLAQEGDGIHFRVRTRLTGPNGSYIHLHVPNVLTENAWHHIVAVFHRGTARLYVDGTFRYPALQGDLPYLPALLGAGRNTAAQAAFCFVFFFPLAWLWSGVHRKGGWAAALLVCMLLNGSIQMFYIANCGQPFGWTFFMLTVGAGIFAVVGRRMSPLR